MSATKTQQRIAALAQCFQAAKDAATAIDNREDGGTCNRDHPAFRIKSVRTSTVLEAASKAGVNVWEFRWFGSRRWFGLGGFLDGQGNCRARMAAAATDALEETSKELCPEMSVLEYCQME